MPCLLALGAFFAPRVVIVLVVLFSDFMGRAYATLLWPLLGFFFAPVTTLAYAAAMNWNGGNVSGAWFAVVLVAALADMGVLGGGVRSRFGR